MCFDVYSIPMQPLYTNSNRLSEQQIDDIILRYTAKYGVTPAHLHLKHSCGRVMRRYELISLQDIRKALALYITSNSDMIYIEVARKLGYRDDHSSVSYHVKTAYQLFEVRDDRFRSYWNSLMEVVV